MSELTRKAGGFLRDDDGVAATEFVLVVPVLLAMIGAAVYAGTAFELERKLTNAAQTLVNITGRQNSIGASSATYSYAQIFQATASVIAPFDPSALSMTLSEVTVVNANTAKVGWSIAKNGKQLTGGSLMTLPASSTSWLGGPTYLIVGTVTYTYKPFAVMQALPAITLTHTVTMAPRNGKSIFCCT